MNAYCILIAVLDYCCNKKTPDISGAFESFVKNGFISL